jgi:hypothetical protein
MTLKVRITKRGAHMMTKDGERELEVGEEITLQSKGIPGFLVGKCELVGEKTGELEVGADAQKTIDELNEKLGKLTAENEALRAEIEALRSGGQPGGEGVSILDFMASSEGEGESLEELRASYKELSNGEEADKRWGEARLNDEINKLLAKDE